MMYKCSCVIIFKHSKCIVLVYSCVWFFSKVGPESSQCSFIDIISRRHPSQLFLFSSSMINQASFLKLCCKSLPCFKSTLEECHQKILKMWQSWTQIVNGFYHFWVCPRLSINCSRLIGSMWRKQNRRIFNHFLYMSLHPKMER